MNNRKNDLQVAETNLGLYPGTIGSMHSLSPGIGAHLSQAGYGPLHSSGLSTGSYDDLHKYGGIGKKGHTTSLYDQGSKGMLGWRLKQECAFLENWSVIRKRSKGEPLYKSERHFLILLLILLVITFGIMCRQFVCKEQKQLDKCLLLDQLTDS